MQCDQLNEVYSVWSKKQVKKENSPECNSKFAALFQNIQIRSSSEALAETVGSIMANRIVKGRYLNPHNFSKEICLEYNLGPLGMYAYIGSSKLSNQSFLPSCIYTPLILQYTLSSQ